MMTNECLDCKMFSCRIAASVTSVSTLSSDHTGRDWNYYTILYYTIITIHAAIQAWRHKQDGQKQRWDKTEEVLGRWSLKEGTQVRGQVWECQIRYVGAIERKWTKGGKKQSCERITCKINHVFVFVNKVWTLIYQLQQKEISKEFYKKKCLLLF